MSFTDIKSKVQAERGFTIVELLIVVVVIAILAAITIVSYNGITNRANGATAQETASNLQKKVETFAADGPTGTYPKTLAELTAQGNSWSTPALWSTGTTSQTNVTPTAAASASLVQYLVCGRTNTAATAPTSIALMTAVTGGRIVYWNYTASPAAVAYNDMGSGAGSVTVNGTSYAVACIAPNA